MMNSKSSVCIVDKDLPLNDDFYQLLMERTASEGISVTYCGDLNEVPENTTSVLLATPVNTEQLGGENIVLGLRSINRRERMVIAANLLPQQNIARWAAPENEEQLRELLDQWGRNEYVFKYDWSAGRKGVKLLNQLTDQLPEDYNPYKDIIMEYLDDDPYTYKADLCCGVLLNAWFLRTEPITSENFNEFTQNPAQYDIPDDLKIQLSKLSTELMRYGSGYISIDMMKYKGVLKIIEINTNSVGRNISWGHFGETYLSTYPRGLKNLLAAEHTLPNLNEIRHLESLHEKILPLKNIPD